MAGYANAVVFWSEDFDDAGTPELGQFADCPANNPDGWQADSTNILTCGTMPCDGDNGFAWGDDYNWLSSDIDIMWSGPIDLTATTGKIEAGFCWITDYDWYWVDYNNTLNFYVTCTDPAGNECDNASYDLVWSNTSSGACESGTAAVDLTPVVGCNAGVAPDCTQIWIGFGYPGTWGGGVAVDDVELNDGGDCPIPGDDCALAITVNCGDSVPGDTTGITNDYNNTDNYKMSDACKPSEGDGGDLVYYLDLVDDCSDLTFTLTSSTGDQDLWVAYYDCTWGSVAADADEVVLECAPSGEYWIFVDGVAGSEGAFDLSITCATPCTVYDDCVTAKTITCNSTLCNEVFNTNCYTQYTDATEGCVSGYQGSATGDKFYAFTLPATPVGWDVTATVDGKVWYGVYTHINLVNDGICDGSWDGNECVDGARFQMDGSVSGSALAPGDYYIYLQGESGHAEDKLFYELSLECIELAEPGDDCTNPKTINCGDVAAAGDLAVMTADYDGTTYGCDPSGGMYLYDGADEVWALTLASPQAVNIVLDDTGHTTLDLFLDDTCDPITGPDGTPIACDDNAISIGCLKTGTYYIFVDCPAGDEAAYTLDVTCTDCAGEDCAGPLSIACGDCVNGFTEGLNNDHSCTYGNAGSDLVYRLTGLTVGNHITITGDADFDADWSIATSCQTDGTDMLDPPGCVDDYGTQADTSCSTLTYHNSNGYFVFSFIATQADYFIWVDTYSLSSSCTYGCNYSLEISCTDGDACVGAMPVECGDTGIPGDTSSRTNTIDAGTYGAGCDLGDGLGNDVWYHIGSLGPNIELTATIASGDVDVYILDGCATCLAAGDTTAAYASTTGSEDYYIVIDHNTGAGGAYTFDVACAFNGVTIGETTCATTDNRIPVNYFYNFSETQYCIPQSELTGLGGDYQVYAMGWYLCSGTTTSGAYVVDIYVDEIVGDCTDICTAPIANSTLVATGIDISGRTGPTWITFPVTPFTYHSGASLIVTVCDTATDYGTGLTFATNSAAGCGYARYNDSEGAFDCDMTTTGDDQFGASSACYSSCRDEWVTTGFCGASLGTPTPIQTATNTPGGPTPTVPPVPSQGGMGVMLLVLLMTISLVAILGRRVRT